MKCEVCDKGFTNLFRDPETGFYQKCNHCGSEYAGSKELEMVFDRDFVVDAIESVLASSEHCTYKYTSEMIIDRLKAYSLLTEL